MPAGWLPDAEVSVTLSDTVPPGAAEPDDKAKVLDWQNAAVPDHKNAMVLNADHNFINRILP